MASDALASQGAKLPAGMVFIDYAEHTLVLAYH